jgi:tetratricopeptide (TPR) repeat protein
MPEPGSGKELDSTIADLRRRLAEVGPEPEIHATLAELHIQRAAEREAGEPRGTEFDLAIGHARAGLRAQPPPEGLYLSLGLALWQRSLNDQRFVYADSDGRIQAARACRDESIGALERALAEHPDQDFLWALAAGALGCAHYNRYSDPWPGVNARDPADREAAIDLLPGALALIPDPLTAVCLVEALADRPGTSDRPGDLDLIITWGHYLLEDAQDLGADLNWVRELTGSALVDRAASGALTRDADLAAGIDQYETALALAPPGDTDRVSLLKKLAQARWLAVDGDDSRYAAMDAMTTAADDAWAVLEPDNPDRALIGMYVAFGIDSRLRRPGEPPSLPSIGHAIEVLSAIEPLLGHEPRSHLQVIILLGHFLVWRGQLAGDISEVSRAEPWILGAASQISLDDPDWRPFVQVLGMAMTILAHLGMNMERLDQAITLLEDITGQRSSDAVVDAMLHGALGFLLAQRAGFTGRLDDLDQGISRMQRSYELAPPGHAYRAAVGANLGSSLAMRFIRSGQVEDVDAARFYLDAAAALNGQAGNDVRALMPDASVVIAANRGTLRALESLRGDAAALDDAVAELEAALVLAPARHPYRSRIQCDLGFALALRGLSGRATVTDAREATRHALAALADLGDGHPVRPMALLHASGALIAAAVAAKEKQPIRDAIAFTTRALGEVDPRFGERFRFVILLGAAAVALHQKTGDPADLETAIGWLEKGRLELAGTPSHPQFAYCLINLARAYHGRPDAGLALETGLTALRARARDLLLQSGTERSLQLARLAAGEAAEVASWCLAEGRPEPAVEALELGRGLILHAATVVAALPELLIGIGRPDLAAAWQESAAADRETPWDTVSQGQEYLAMLRAGPSPLDVPDDVRVRVFAALAGSPAEQRLLSPPTVTEMAGALAETGAHVLVYLVPPLNGGSGHAVLVRAGDSRPANCAPAEIVSLRFLGADALEAYSQAHAAMSAEQTAMEDPEATRSRVVRDWYQSLGDLCEWAWSGAILPILSKLREWQVGQPPRLVLIAGSTLSLVPWHAARSGSAEAGTVRYALQDAVFSYAASARQLVDAARRPPLALAESPVILGDPTGTLPQAVLEAQAIHDRCYPSGRYLGGTSSGWPGTVAGEGSPSQILRELPRADRPGASVLHLGCHSWVANSGPGQSHLVLAEGGKLPVDAILNQAKDRPVSAPGGLVSLAACRSDLAAAEYDEALTLSTAFLAAGAVTVVGSRWEIPDSATSLLMFMFHLRVARYGDSPRDALRLAQLWLLNPDREPPEEMPAGLAQRARRLRLRDITAWAGFVHQGR